ncbi:MAG TPA: L-seryl-tRNA(Sec) selenium transferase [Ktedonobacterales bacterium]
MSRRANRTDQSEYAQPAVAIHDERTPEKARKRTLRGLPSVEATRKALVAQLRAAGAAEPAGTTLVEAARAAIAQSRSSVLAGGTIPSLAEVVNLAQTRLHSHHQSHLRPVINATGTILHTNLGRAPLSARAIERIVQVAAGYSNLEYDLERGERGSRQAHVRDLLCALTGAEDALVVNNNAAAALLTLTALATGREVIVSRGELVEIGGGFRIPDILAQSGARMVEVGTTNRVRLADYAAAITPDTALILSVHPSNFRIVGFTAAPDLSALASLAHEHDLLLARDLGSGALLDTTRWNLTGEDTVMASHRAGADVTCFSGDKLLGGPQAGIITGSRSALARIERHPLMRAVRSDKLTLAALEETLKAYRDGEAVSELPVWRMIAMPIEEVRTRARSWVGSLAAAGVNAAVMTGESTIGGGSLPGETLPTALCAIQYEGPVASERLSSLLQELRQGEPAVLGRIARDRALFDPRTVPPSLDSALIAAVIAAWRRQQGSEFNY